MGTSAKTAAVKLTLNTGSFMVSIREVGKEHEKAAKTAESAWKTSGVAGLKAVGKELASVGSSIKSTIRQVATLGGALSLGGGIKGAVDAQRKFRDLAFAIEAGTGKAADWQRLMGEARDVAIATGQSTEELGTAFRSMFEEVGDADFASAALRTIATQATATGDSIQTLASIAGTMNEKFGITAAELPQALAVAKGLGSKGGITFDEMGEKLSILGASAKKAGMQGVDGFQRIIALANVGDDATGGLRKNISAVTTLLEKLGTKDQQKQIKQTFGVDVTDAKGKAKDATKVLGEIFGKTRGKKETLEKVFAGPESQYIVELGQKYAKKFDETKGDVKTKTAAALKAYNDALEEAGRSALDRARVEKEAADRVKDPERQLQSALEQVGKAFAQPAMIEAINKMAQKVPELAETLSHLIGFVLENPGTSAAIVGGFKIGSTFMEATLAAAGPSIAKAIGEAFLVSGGGGAVPAAAAPVVEGAAATEGAVVAGGSVAGASAAILAIAALPAAVAGYLGYRNTKNQSTGEAEAKALAGDETGTKEGRVANLQAMIERASMAKAAAARVRDKGESEYLPQNKASLDTEALGMAKQLPALMAALSQLTGAVTSKARDIKDVKIVNPSVPSGGGGGGGGAYRGPPPTSRPRPGYEDRH